MGARTVHLATLALATAATLGGSPAAGEAVTHLHNLADFTGIVPTNHPGLVIDRENGEIFVADGDVVRIFNRSGMEIWKMRIAPPPIGTRGVAVDDEGDILVLARRDGAAPAFCVERLDYRGNPKGTIEVQGLPAAFERIAPSILAWCEGRIYFVSTMQLLAVVTDESGRFERGYDFGALLEIPEKDRDSTELGGFGLDASGNMLLTVPVLFQAFVVSPEGKITAFGKAGSAPGRFGVVAGIASDDRGHTFVADKLRSVVLVFDERFQFVTEFGQYGLAPENLVRPNDVVTDADGRIYVTQLRDRGVSVFSLARE